MKKSLLAVFPMLPWPIRANGLGLRHYPVLDYLADRYNVDVQVIGNYSQSGPVPDDPLLRKLRWFNVCDISEPPSLARRLPAMIKFAMPWGTPYDFASYVTPRATEVVAERLAQVDYDAVLWVTAANVDAVKPLKQRFPRPHYFIDLVDSPYLHYARRNLSSAFHRMDVRKTKRWESNLCRQHDAIYVSPVDARAAGDHHAIVIPNGIAIDDYVERSPSDEPCIGFLGNMGYRPNIEAVQMLYQHVLPKLGDAKLMIIGRDPDPVIQRMAGPNVTVTGAVHDIWEYIQKVSVMVFPMISGGGLQNKVLESMFAGIPVVTTDICNASVGARHGEQILSAPAIDEMPEMVRTLLAEPALRKKIGQAGRQFVMDRYHTPSIVRAFERTLFQPDVLGDLAPVDVGSDKSPGLVVGSPRV